MVMTPFSAPSAPTTTTTPATTTTSKYGLMCIMNNVMIQDVYFSHN
jgi:hypothetical protein